MRPLSRPHSSQTAKAPQNAAGPEVPGPHLIKHVSPARHERFAVTLCGPHAHIAMQGTSTACTPQHSSGHHALQRRLPLPSPTHGRTIILILFAVMLHPWRADYLNWRTGKLLDGLYRALLMSEGLGNLRRRLTRRTRARPTVSEISQRLQEHPMSPCCNRKSII